MTLCCQILKSTLTCHFKLSPAYEKFNHSLFKFLPLVSRTPHSWFLSQLTSHTFSVLFCFCWFLLNIGVPQDLILRFLFSLSIASVGISSSLMNLCYCHRRSLRGHDCRFTYEPVPGNQRVLIFFPVVGMCSLFAFPMLEASQGHTLETVMWFWHHLDGIHD